MPSTVHNDIGMSAHGLLVAGHLSVIGSRSGNNTYLHIEAPGFRNTCAKPLICSPHHLPIQCVQIVSGSSDASEVEMRCQTSRSQGS